MAFSPRAVLSGFVLWLIASSALAGQMLIVEIQSDVLNRPWQFSVYLPDGYDTSEARLPAVYLLHGNGGDHLSWPGLGIENIVDELITAGDIPPAVIIMPEANTTWYVDRKEAMETAFINELIPEVERQFRVQLERRGRYVGGFSMGGYGAMRFALKYPQLFAGAALLSPAIYNPVPPLDSSARRVGVFGATRFEKDVWEDLNYPELWEDYLTSGFEVPMYINSGDDDQFFIEKEATAFYSLLRGHGLPAELRIVDGGHTGAVWGSTVDEALRYLFRQTSE